MRRRVTMGAFTAKLTTTRAHVEPVNLVKRTLWILVTLSLILVPVAAADPGDVFPLQMPDPQGGCTFIDPRVIPPVWTGPCMPPQPTP